MTDAMAARGPDGEGQWCGPGDTLGNAVMLGHRRLSIIDLSSAAGQPMTDPSHGNVVVFNGEIYNYRELRSGFGTNEQLPSSSGDTAAMLRHLSVHGFDAVSALRGMFAIALWNPRSRQLLLARDALGMKPLYLMKNPQRNDTWAFAFASEVRALLASGLHRQPTLRPSSVATIVWNGFTTAPETVIDGIESLLPGEMRVFSQGGEELHRRRYWTQAALCSGSRSSREEAAAALEDSVRRHLLADVPLGVFLSGGVDSSALANIAQRVSKAKVHSFTLSFSGHAGNEGAFARAVADAIGTEHHEIPLTHEHFVDHLDRAIGSLDQPSFDGLNSFFMAEAVAEAGFKVALVGSGGDELFGGYNTFRDLPKVASWSRRSSFLPRKVRTLAAQALAAARTPRSAGFPVQTRWAKLPAMAAANDVLDLYQLAYALFLPGTYAELLSPAIRPFAGVQGLPDSLAGHLRAEIADCSSDLAAIAVLETRLFLGERLLRDTDATSMASSIEIRLPLVDQDVLETVTRLSDVDRFEPVTSKQALKDIGLAGLDPQLFDRPKAGFELPYNDWLRGVLGSQVASVLRDADLIESVGLSSKAVAALWEAYSSGAPGLYWTRVWCIYVLAAWAKRYGLQIRPH